MQHFIRRSIAPLTTTLALTAPAALAQSYDLGLQGGADLGDGNLLGAAVDVDGATAVGGAVGHVDGTIPGSGAVWVYERGPLGLWTDVERLFAFDGDLGDLFGDAVAISGDRIAVGAPGDDDLGSSAGAVYVFEREPGGPFLFAAKLTASDGSAGHDFGDSVALDGDVLAVGAPDGQTSGIFSGSAYVFELQPDGSWTETAKLAQADFGNNDDFGESISVSDGRVLVGAPQEDPNVKVNAGSAYLFERQADGTWPQVAKLSASDGDSLDSFGFAVALAGDHAAIGAWLDEDGNSVGNGTGSAYAFERQADGSWLEVAKLLDPEGDSGDHFGMSIAADGDAILVGSIHDNLGTTLDAGSAHLFLRDASGAWNHLERIESGSSHKDDNFGHGVAISGGNLVVGASNDDEFMDNGGSVLVRFSYPGAGVNPPVFHGTGTPGCDGPIALDMASAPIVGNAGFGFTASPVEPGSTGFLAIADTSDLAGSDLLGLGATLYVDLTSSFLLVLPITADADGQASTLVPIPDSASLVGLELHAQALWVGLPCGGSASSNLVSFELLEQ